MNQSLNNQVGIITGAASGLGLVISLKLSQSGVRLILVDKNEEGLKKITSQFENEHELCAVDITKENEVKQLVEKTIDRFGRIDVLVNSAGVTGKTNIKSH